MIDRSARRAAAVGALASLPPGLGRPRGDGPRAGGAHRPAEPADRRPSRPVRRDPEPEERALEVLAGLAAGAGLNVGRRLTTRAAEEIGGPAGRPDRGPRGDPRRAAPGAVASAALNYAAVRAVGRAALARVERLYGPPEVPGTGPVLEVKGGVA